MNTEIYLSNQLKLKLNKIKHNKFELQITNIRKESIAHNDTLKNKYSITLNEIYELLVEIRKNYNLICKNFKAIKSINNFFISKVRKESEVAVELVFNGYIANLNKQNEP